MEQRNYWGYRTNKDNPKFFWDELMKNRLRQGWGYNERQNLRNFTMDEGEELYKGLKDNFRIFYNVKKGDILLIPHLKEFDEVAIVEATEDFDIGYEYKMFEFTKDSGYSHFIPKDFGHIFPAKYLTRFKRHNENVSANIRSTLRYQGRFWNINHYAEDVENLLKMKEDDLSTIQSQEDRFDNSIENVFDEIFDEREFQDNLYKKMTEQFQSAEWEYALVHGFRKLFPSYNIEPVGGGNEKDHGTDILIKIPGIIDDYEYAIAIQVKDYEGFVSDDVIEQINKSEKYWKDIENLKVIEKIVIITKAEKKENIKLVDNKSGVKFIFANDLKTLLSNIGKVHIGIKT